MIITQKPCISAHTARKIPCLGTESKWPVMLRGGQRTSSMWWMIASPSLWPYLDHGFYFSPQADVQHERHPLKSACMALAPLYEKQTAVSLNARTEQKEMSLHKRQKEGMLTTYCEVVNNSLGLALTDDMIPDTESMTLRSLHLLRKMPNEYGKLVWAKALRWDLFYNEYVLKVHFIKGFQDPIWKSMRLSWEST